MRVRKNQVANFLLVVKFLQIEARHPEGTKINLGNFMYCGRKVYYRQLKQILTKLEKEKVLTVSSCRGYYDSESSKFKNHSSTIKINRRRLNEFWQNTKEYLFSIGRD